MVELTPSAIEEVKRMIEKEEKAHAQALVELQKNEINADILSR